MLQNPRMRVAWLFLLLRTAIVAVNRYFDLGALEAMHVRVMRMEDKVHRNEEQVVDGGLMECVGLVEAVLQAVDVGGDVRFAR